MLVRHDLIGRAKNHRLLKISGAGVGFLLRSEGGAVAAQFNTNRRRGVASAQFDTHCYSAYQQPNPLRPVEGVRALFPGRLS